MEDLKEAVIKFLDNNGCGTCDHCKDAQLADSSGNLREIVVSMNTNNLTSYSRYIQVQDELTRAYYDLRAN